MKNVNERQDAVFNTGHNKQTWSRGPSFSSDDIVKIISSLRGGMSSQPLEQGVHSHSKGLDYKNIIP